MGRGKSYCTSGMLYFFAASCSSGAARAQSGHCRSSKTRMATFDPLGGRKTEVSPAQAAAARSRHEVNRRAEKNGFSFICNGRWRDQLTRHSLNIVTEIASGSLAGVRLAETLYRLIGEPGADSPGNPCPGSRGRAFHLYGVCIAFRMSSSPHPKTALGIELPGKLLQLCVLVSGRAVLVSCVVVAAICPLKVGLARHSRATPAAT